jgi:hypothetical protein
MNTHTAILEDIYDNYSPMLYSIALQISPTQKDAEDILICTFQQINQYQLAQQTHSFICVTLIRLIIQTAQQHFNALPFNEKTQLKQFKDTPLLRQLFCEATTIEEYCAKSGLSSVAVVKKMQEEFFIMRRFSTIRQPEFQ